ANASVARPAFAAARGRDERYDDDAGDSAEELQADRRSPSRTVVMVKTIAAAIVMRSRLRSTAPPAPIDPPPPPNMSESPVPLPECNRMKSTSSNDTTVCTPT